MKIEHRLTFSQVEMHRLAEESEYALVNQVLEKLPDIQSQRHFIDAYHRQISELRGRVHAYPQGFGAAGGRIEVTANADGWQLRVTFGGTRDYAAKRDRAGVLQDTGGSLLDEPFDEDGMEVGMALSILAEALDDLSDALCRRAQGGE